MTGVGDEIRARPKPGAPVTEAVPAGKVPTTTCAAEASVLPPVVRSLSSIVVRPGGSCTGKLQRSPGGSGVESGFVLVFVMSQ